MKTCVASVASVASVANTSMFPGLKVTCSLNKIRSLGKQEWNDSKSSWTSKQDPCQPQSSLRSKIPQNISQNLPWNPKTVGILLRFNSRLQAKKPYSHTVYSTYPEFTYERFGTEKNYASHHEVTIHRLANRWVHSDPS